MKKQNKRRMFFANRLHKDLFLLIFLGAIIPALIAEIAVFYLIFNLTAEQMAFPETIIYNLIPVAKRVAGMLFVASPLIIIVILILAYRITHRIVGPFDRIVRELDECISGKKTTPITLRKNDKFWPLVERINTLLAKARK